MAHNLAPGSLLIGRYRILSLAGAGGMGAVYKAADTQLGDRPVALKELSESGLTPVELAEATEAFKREALLLAELHHPGLPSIHDHFTTGGRWYLVMDFIEGETLEDYLHHAGRPGLPVAQVLRIAEHLCAVLDYLHHHVPPIIFRDLKPSNVMVTRAASGQSPDQFQLIDFGIARLFKPGQTHDTVSFGSSGYAAPEQYGKAQTTVRSDIFSFGALLHQLLTGIDPSITPFAFPPIQPYNAQTPPALEALILWMVQLDPSKRPPSVAVVSQELDQIVRQMHGVPPVIPPQQRAALAVPLAPISSMTWGPPPTAHLGPSARERRAPRGLVVLGSIGAALVVLCIVVQTCASALGQDIAAGQSAAATAAVQQADAQATETAQAVLDQAVTDANAHLSTDLNGLSSDVPSLATVPDFSSVLTSYANDWAQMQKDYQTEHTDYQQGCGPYGGNAITVRDDAIAVHDDLIAIQDDDIALGDDVRPFNSDIGSVQSDMQTVQSDWTTLQNAVAADGAGSVSAQFTSSDVNTAVSNAQKQVDASNKALKAAQASAKQYDTESGQKDTDAQNLADSMHC